MDNSFHRQGSDTRQPNPLLAGLSIITRFLNWLASLLQLTEEEQNDAGIYPGDLHYKE